MLKLFVSLWVTTKFWLLVAMLLIDSCRLLVNSIGVLVTCEGYLLACRFPGLTVEGYWFAEESFW